MRAEGILFGRFYFAHSSSIPSQRRAPRLRVYLVYPIHDASSYSWQEEGTPLETILSSSCNYFWQRWCASLKYYSWQVLMVILGILSSILQLTSALSFSELPAAVAVLFWDIFFLFLSFYCSQEESTPLGASSCFFETTFMHVLGTPLVLTFQGLSEDQTT